jgi:hypothetical protein
MDPLVNDVMPFSYLSVLLEKVAFHELIVLSTHYLYLQYLTSPYLSITLRSAFFSS